MKKQTGENDINGKDIYEGDKVRCNYTVGSTIPKDIIGFVRYYPKEDKFKIITHGDGGSISIHHTFGEDIANRIEVLERNPA